MLKSALTWVGGCLVLGGCLSLASLGPDTESPEPRPYEVTGVRAIPAEPNSAGSSVRSDRFDPGLSSARQAVEAALPFLQEHGIAWMEGRVPIQEGAPCVSCHHVPFAVWSHAEAARAGLEVGAGMPDLTRRAVEFLGRPDKPRALNVAPMLLSPVDSGPLSEAWTSVSGGDLVAELQEQRERSGGWRARGQFPTQRRPTSESDEVATLWSRLALRVHGETDVIQDEAAVSTDGKTIEWLATRVLSSPELERQGTIRALIDAQNADGGWPWASGEVSNAYSTGQAVYALASVGGDPGRDHSELNDALSRARRYLVESQEPDGTWRVPSALISEEGTHERDVIYHYWGTAWAVIGLARSL